MKFNKTKSNYLVPVVVAILISLMIAFVLIAITSPEPVNALVDFVISPLSSPRRISLLINRTVPLVFIGLGFTVMFKAGQFNLTPVGLFYLSAVFAAMVGIFIPLPEGLHPLVGIIISATISGLLAVIPGLLKFKFSANIIVSSLMINYIFFNLGMFILEGIIRDKETGNMVSSRFLPTATLGRVLPNFSFHWGAIIAVIIVIVVHLLLTKTSLGYEISITGDNPKFTNYVGGGVWKILLISQFIGGFLTGIGGAIEMYGMYDRFLWTTDPGYGWDGFLVAILAKNNPKFIPIAALFLAYLSVGSDAIVQRWAVPPDLVPAIRAIMIIIIGSQWLINYWNKRQMVKEKQKLDEVSVDG